MFAILAVAVIGGIALFWGVVVVPEDRKRREAERAREDARREEQRQRAVALAAARPLVTFTAAGRAKELSDEANLLLISADEIRTFEQVARWDAAAGAHAERIQAFLLATAQFCEFAHAKADACAAAEWAAAERTREQLRLAQSEVREADLEQRYETLVEFIDLTPNDKKEQTALLRELRAEKKEMTARKREARADIAAVRREGRSRSIEAGVGVWTTYDRRVAAAERRSIRRAVEAAVQPHESEVAAIDRQILALDRRIAWVQRFGDT
jgi:hypothetical protein